jgi:hypothetical protein
MPEPFNRCGTKKDDMYTAEIIYSPQMLDTVILVKYKINFYHEDQLLTIRTSSTEKGAYKLRDSMLKQLNQYGHADKVIIPR